MVVDSSSSTENHQPSIPGYLDAKLHILEPGGTA